MYDYADSYEPLIVKQTSPSEIEVIDDFNYNLMKHGSFATGYTQLQQKNFVQLPTGLEDPKKVSKTKFTFTPAKPAEEENEESQPVPEQSPTESQSDEIKSSSNSSSSSSSISSSSLSSSSDDEADRVNMPTT